MGNEGMLVDLKVAQFLCSRLCHDLAGPVGAVNAGLELLDEGAGDAQDALTLVAQSAREMTRRLAFFRMAFGLGAGAGGVIALDEARDLAAGLLTAGRVTLDWPRDTSRDRTMPAAALKLVLNLVLLGAESLPRGGALRVHFADLPEGVGAAVTAIGDGARFSDNLRAAMVADVPAGQLSATTVHAHFAARLAEDFGVTVEVSESAPGEVRLAVLLPADRLD